MLINHILTHILQIFTTLDDLKCWLRVRWCYARHTRAFISHVDARAMSSMRLLVCTIMYFCKILYHAIITAELLTELRFLIMLESHCDLYKYIKTSRYSETLIDIMHFRNTWMYRFLYFLEYFFNCQCLINDTGHPVALVNNMNWY